MTRRVPAEWEPREATILAWTHNADDWPGKHAAVVWAFVEFLRKAAETEPVFLLVPDTSRETRAKRALRKAEVNLERVTFLQTPLDRSWARDFSPFFVERKSERVAVDCRFDGWAKYDNWRLDDAAGSALAERFGDVVEKPTLRGERFTFEGGAIDFDGAGAALVTEECLLDPTTQVRNPGATKADYERIFEERFGVERTIWLEAGIVGDDTHGHVDDCARFVAPGTIAAATADSTDENHAPLAANLERLADARLADGSRPEILRLPSPAPLRFEGVRLPASYANFHFTRDRLLVPTFNDPADRIALGVLAEALPDREIVGVHAVDTVWGFGTLHCLSNGIPARRNP
jgi:agmatine deiminase